MSIKDDTREALSLFMPPERSPAPSDESQPDATEPWERIEDVDYPARGFHLEARLSSGNLVAAVSAMFDLGFYLEAITGIDWPDDGQIEAVYDFSRYDFDLCRVAIKVRTPRKTPTLPTITSLYSGANWHEREAHDFFGIVFDGHPHLVPLLLPEDADFHPLLKDFRP